MPVVCGTDLSDNAKSAVRTAAAMASRFGDRHLFVVHVLDVHFGAVGSALEAEIRGRLSNDVSELTREFDLRKVESTLLVGSPNLELPKFAASKEASLLVVASKGHGDSTQHRVGGTSERVATASEVPVLVVHDERPFEAWIRGNRSLRIVVGVDFTASSGAAVTLVRMLRSAGPCDVIAAHVYYPNDAAARYGLRDGLSVVDRDDRVEALLRRDLVPRTDELGGTGDAKFEAVVGIGRLGDHLLALAEKERADLVVVGTHHRTGLRRLASVSSVVLQFAHASVACAPVGAAVVEAPREIKRILIATNLSPYSNHSIAYGYSLLLGRSDRPSGEAFLLHVAAPDGQSRPSINSEIDLAARLRALVPKWVEEHGIVTRTETVHRDDVARAICETAARVGADVICMGSRGRSGIERAVLGSIATRVLRGSDRPVMIIHAPAL